MTEEDATFTLMHRRVVHVQDTTTKTTPASPMPVPKEINEKEVPVADAAAQWAARKKLLSIVVPYATSIVLLWLGVLVLAHCWSFWRYNETCQVDPVTHKSYCYRDFLPAEGLCTTTTTVLTKIIPLIMAGLGGVLFLFFSVLHCNGMLVSSSTTPADASNREDEDDVREE